MSDHLPECWCAARCPKYVGATCPCRDCICDELRACEQRVNDEWVRDYGGHRAFALGVQAAREAVAASSDHYDLCICDECCGTEAALAAIDALSENPDDLPVSENPNDAR